MSTTRTVLGPLTTTYTFPEACTNLVAAQGEGQGNAWQAQSCAVSTFSDDTYTDSQEDDAACWPTVTASTPTPPLEGWGFYSPGLVCPAGWTSACTAALSSNGQTSPVISGTSFTPQWSLTAGETAVGCCPTYGYHYIQLQAQTDMKFLY
ncbi:hypothetical protein EV356DRAFT_502747 [Viridothelium virens]|uniref:Uncharacterized protein n=1 Tax=Viridothelium virens TaxID=1048519 RepID=A0A6A6H7Y5_VIRVR|nr:hypothetical protein EV356DRAFT_502747 [Viridothelium virens]